MNREQYFIARKERHKDDFLFWYYNRSGGKIRHPNQFKILFSKWCINTSKGIPLDVAKIKILTYLDKKHLRS